MIDTLIYFFYAMLFLLTPLAMASNTLELFEFNKMMLIYILTVCIAFFWVLKMIKYKTIILKKTFLDIPLLFFTAILVISTIFSIDIHTSLFGYYGRFNGGLLSIICYILLFYAFISNVSLQQMRRLLKISIFSSFLVMLWGLPGRFGHDLSCLLFIGQWDNSCWTDQFHPDVRMFSTLGQPNWLGVYLAINFFIALYFLLEKKSENTVSSQKGYQMKNIQQKSMNWQPYLWYGYLILNYIFIIFTRSRSALGAVVLGVIGVLIFLFFDYYKKGDLSQYLKYLSIWLVILFIPVAVFKSGIQTIDKFLVLPDFNKKSSVKIVSKPVVDTSNILITESFDIRKIVWQGAIELGKKYPLFGTGPETFAYAYYFVRPVAHNYVSEWDYLYNKAHNEFLNYLATTGFIGLGSYFLIIGIVLLYLMKLILDNKSSNLVIGQFSNRAIFSICLLFSYFSILITNFFGFSTTTVNLFFFLIPGFFILNSEETLEKKKLPEKNIQYSLRQIIGILFSLLLFVFLLFAIIRYWLADTYYAKADLYTKSNDFQTAALLVYNALNLKYEHVYEDKLSYILANMAVLASYQKKDQLVNQFIQDSIKYNKNSLKSSPKNVLYWKTQAKNDYLFYQISLKSNQLIDGVNALKSASFYSPTDPKIPYSLAIFYSLLFDETKATTNKEQYKILSLQVIDNCIHLKSDYRDAYFLKGQLLKKYGNKTEAKKTFQYILDHLNKNDSDAQKELQSI